ncbi:MAG: ABC transporter ATP-binding protein [Atopobiaceae bacterium]|nr:ABC transporter ATP-binding protein [Olsenella sp.]MDY3900244.1 ABC transporter ATP-binding protein [Atopobiaceae bacterium]
MSSDKDERLEAEASAGAGGTGAGAPGADEDMVPTAPRETALRLWRVAGRQRWRIVVAAACAVLYVVFSLASATFSAVVVDFVWEEAQRAFAAGSLYVVDYAHGGRLILQYFGLWTLAWGFYAVQSFVMASFAERLNLELRRRIADKLARLPLAYFDRHQPGDTISYATNDMDKISEVMQRGLLQLIIAACMLVGALVCMARRSVVLTLMFCGFAVASALATWAFGAQTNKAVGRRQALLGELTSEVEESYSGRTEVQAFGLEGRSLAAVSEKAERLARAGARADFVTNAIGPCIRFVMRLCMVTIGVTAGGMLLAGQMTVGVFQAFFQYVMQGSEPLTQFSVSYNMLQGALAAAERVFGFLDEPEVEPDPARPAALARPVRGRVCFEHVRFGYDADHPLMHDVSFVAEPGEKVAIVGETGAGKTTLVNLLMRFYEIDGGRITLDGVDTRRLTRADLRREFGMVLQDAWLFEGTIAENIAYGCPGATREEVEAAARAAHVDFFVRTLPHGYDTVLENDASAVSQGQRQLLTIARAMLADPAILILDEATSSVDTRTEQAIVRAMEAIMENRTSFVIAHRLSTIVDADLILVMDHGNIIEKGTHEELLAAGGAYAALYQSQFA